MVARKNASKVAAKVEEKAAPEAANNSAVDAVQVEAKDAVVAEKTVEESKVLTEALDINAGNVSEFKLFSFDKLPERLGGGRRKYDFESMVPGKWFFIPNDNDKDDVSKRLSTSASAAGRRLGKKFTVRTMIHEGLKGAGVFCIDPSA